MAVELQDVQVRSDLQWTEVFPRGSKGQEAPEFIGHRTDRRITGTGPLSDDLTVFRLEDGSEINWGERPINVDIRAILADYPWPKARSIHFSMDPDEQLPDEGRLKDEPGRLDYWPEMCPKYAADPYIREGVHLSLYAEPDAFDRLMDDLLRSPRQVAKLTVEVSADLFQHEVDDFFSPRNPREEFGLLMKSDGERSYAWTRARLERISVSFEVNRAPAGGGAKTDEGEAGQGAADRLRPHAGSPWSAISTVVLVVGGILLALALNG